MEHQKEEAYRENEKYKFNQMRGHQTIEDSSDEEKKAAHEKEAKLIPPKNMVLPRNKWGQPILYKAKICAGDNDKLQKDIPRTEF